MKKILLIVLLLVVTAGIVFALGPRPDTNDTVTFDPSSLGEDLDAYLENTEAGIANLVDGAEKEIVWANAFRKEKTPYAVIYVHGFSATKHETRPVADNVAKSLGANLYFTRFQGHGRDGHGLVEATVQGWANDFAEAIEIGKRIGDKIIIIAVSNGATISTWGLAKPEYSGSVAGIVFGSPNFELTGISTSLANIPWAETILPAIAGANRSWEPANEEHGKWWTTSYPSRAIFPMTAMLKLTKEIDKSGIKVPALFIYHPQDRVVVPAEIEKAIDEWGGPVEVLKIEESSDQYNHVIMGDILSPENTGPATQNIIDWVNSLAD
ncbi:MAG: alpha/beta hydrolase [Pseudomonadota bacterium]